MILTASAAGLIAEAVFRVALAFFQIDEATFSVALVTQTIASSPLLTALVIRQAAQPGGAAGLSGLALCASK